MKIEIQDVSYTYQRHRSALAGCSFACAGGEITAVLGPNGSGKTTLFELLSRQRPWQSGGCTVVDGPKFGDLVVGWASSDPVFYETTPVSTFVERTYGPAFGLTRAESAGRGSALAKALRFEDDYARPPRELSRGNRTKASILLAMLHEPALLLLDEPFTGLDLGTVDALLAVLDDYAHVRKACVVLADHQVGALDAIVDHVAFIEDGKIVHAARRDELLARHGTLSDAYRSVFHH
ncbi:MAG TPA: ABC transporter ATP-binding protein [Candidatus Krumholzibacteria bacterium]|nr:ABC transporter ATP-binding protein [Candidatus Krumholzibacteria bacterium]